MRKMRKISPINFVFTLLFLMCLTLMYISYRDNLTVNYEISVQDISIFFLSSIVTVGLAIYIIRNVEWNSSIRKAENEIMINLLKEIFPICDKLNTLVNDTNYEYTLVVTYCKQITFVLKNLKELSESIKKRSCKERNDKVLLSLRQLRKNYTTVINSADSSHLVVDNGKIISIGIDKKQQIIKNIESLRVNIYLYWAELNKM